MSKWSGINRAKAKRRPGAMNGTERKRAQILEGLRHAGHILHWMYEPVKLKLGKASYYCPDFLIVLPDMTIVFEEVKGQRGWKLSPHGRTKWKVAASLFPFLQFRGVLLSDRNTWTIEEHEPCDAFPPIATASDFDLSLFASP